jgi:hypothetical protein
MKPHRIARPGRPVVTLLAGAVALSACDGIVPTETDPGPRFAVSEAPAPASLMSVMAAGATRTLWPFTGTSVGADVHASDPINLIFVGDADPLSIRAALLSLDGDRTAFPPLPFFGCMWGDAMGGNQTAWSDAEGWSGSAIQLECGSYTGLRFHLRLFRAGEWTLGNAHFETVIPGTHEHEVLNWELAEQFVTADLARAGVLVAPPAVTPAINPRPFFRTINPLLYWHPQLVPLHPIINAVVMDPQTIGIRTDGQATVLTLGNAVRSVPGHTRQEIEIAFDQIIPKPFCAGPADYLYVQGPLKLRQEVTVTPAGVLTREFHASGELVATPVTPITRQPLGPPALATISGLYKGMVSSRLHSTSSLLTQSLLREGEEPQRLMTELQVGPHGVTRIRRQEQCGS